MNDLEKQIQNNIESTEERKQMLLDSCDQLQATIDRVLENLKKWAHE